MEIIRDYIGEFGIDEDTSIYVAKNNDIICHDEVCRLDDDILDSKVSSVGFDVSVLEYVFRID